jgi:hypothetical protein
MKTSEKIFVAVSISTNISKWVILIWMGILLYEYSKEAFWGLFFFFLGIIIFADLKNCIIEIIRNNSNKKG